MDYKKAIEVLANEIGCVDLDTNNRGYIDESEQKFMDACNTAISAMEELQEYHKTGLSFKQVADTIFELGATKRVLGHYQQLGTLEEVWEALEKAERYHWHDLRKNPEDLPEPEVECEVVVERTYSNYRMNEHARMLELTDGIYWYAEHYGVVQHPKYKMGYGGDHTIEVIAWRKIEPFREVE